MSYIENNLSPNEKLLLKTYISNNILIISFAFVIFGLMPLYQIIITKNKIIAIGLFFIMVVFFSMALFTLATLSIRILTTEYAITNKRILTKQGLIRLKADEIRLSKIESINVEKNLIQALLGIGNITIRGTGGGKILLQSINNPKYTRYEITKIIEKYPS